jgi:hypothetical protein
MVDKGIYIDELHSTGSSLSSYSALEEILFITHVHKSILQDPSQFIHLQPLSLRFILILSFHLHPGLLGGIFP